MSIAVACKDFGFSFPEADIIRHISFELEEGTYMSIIGTNGSGKSTLLKSLLRLHERGRSHGEAFICGKPLEQCSQKELASMIGYVPQAGGRIPPFTVMEFLKLSRYPYRRRHEALGLHDRECIDEAMELTGTAALAHKKLDELSGGQRQRAFLAAALAQDTSILLLDEPASFLDPRHAYELNALLKKLNRERGKTIITVTHDLNHPLDAGGVALVMRNSRQVYFGPSSKLAERGILETAFEHEFTRIVHPKTGQTLVFAE